MEKSFHSFSEFYPYYLSEHQDPVCRTLHYVGTTIVLCTLVLVIFLQAYVLLLAIPVAGYAFAWLGHFVFERNRPATFKYPLYSLMADFVMYRDFLSGRFRRGGFLSQPSNDS